MDLITYETARGNLYRALSRLFLVPGADMGILLDSTQCCAQTLGSDAAVHIAIMGNHIKTAPQMDALAVAFAKLFIGPFRAIASPYGSVYLESERRLMGDSTMAVLDHYRQAGFDLSPDFKDAPDHVAAELEFMYTLIHLETGALQRGDSETATDTLSRQQRFLHEHLCNWIGPFTEKIVEAPQTDFYRHLAKATQAFIAEESASALNIEISALQAEGATQKRSAGRR